VHETDYTGHAEKPASVYCEGIGGSMKRTSKDTLKRIMLEVRIYGLLCQTEEFEKRENQRKKEDERKRKKGKRI
jgi:putative hemolysin